MPFTDKDHSTSPRVTVIVPVYNQAEFLPECLGSLRAQTISTWQAIIVDDASETGAAEAVVQAEKDSRFQLIRHDCNRGLAASRNTGIRAARTRWVLCLDADDKLADDALETLLSLADRHPDGHAFFGIFKPSESLIERCRRPVRHRASFSLSGSCPAPAFCCA